MFELNQVLIRKHDSFVGGKRAKNTKPYWLRAQLVSRITNKIVLERTFGCIS